MGQPARVLLVGKDDGENALSHTLRLCSWDCIEVGPDGEPPSDMTGPDRPDVVILNLLSEFGRRPPRDFVGFARAVRALPGGPTLPVMMVGERIPEHAAGALLAASDVDVDDVMLCPLNGIQISSHLKALTRLATMHEELLCRFGDLQPLWHRCTNLDPGHVADRKCRGADCWNRPIAWHV